MRLFDRDPATAEAIGRWVAASVELPSFWSARPRWIDGVARRPVDGELLVWCETGAFAMRREATAVAVHLGPTTSLQELVEDVASVGVATPDAQILVARTAVELAAAGAVEGVELADPPHVLDAERPDDAEHGDAKGPDGEPFGESFRLDPVTGSRLRIEVGLDSSGNVVRTVHLPGGRRQITTQMRLVGSGATNEAGPMAQVEALLDGRSPAELLPVDSCLGSKIRNLDEVPLLTMRGAAGALVSVRCHSKAVTAALRSDAGALLAPGERGPIEVFVVTPLEGAGPARLYDRLGRRVGRPRSTEEIVTAVDQMVGQRFLDADGGRVDLLPMPLVPVTSPAGRPILVPDSVTVDGAWLRTFRRNGWEVGLGRVAVTGDGRVIVPSAWRDGRELGLGEVTVAWPGGAAMAPAAQAMALFAEHLRPPRVNGATLEALGQVVEQAHFADLDRVLVEQDA